MKTMRNWLLNRRERGQTFVLFTFFLVVLILFIGLGIDLGFAYITRSNLSKACDAACLAGIDNYWQGQDVAKAIATNTFTVNYGRSGRDVTPPVPAVTFTTDGSNNTTLSVTASASIRTFFIRILPQWKTLTVANAAAALRAHVIMSIVLDRSGSMGDICSTDRKTRMEYLHDAVTNFISYFDDNIDRAALISFSNCSRVDLTMQKPFKQLVTTKTLALAPENWTASPTGMADGWKQISNFNPPSGEVVQRVIVFFTDGYANAFSNNFTCGSTRSRTNVIMNIVPGGGLYDPSTTNCFANTLSNCGPNPSPIASVNPAYTQFSSFGSSYPETAAPGQPNMRAEAEARALVYANLARAANPPTFVYAIGLGCDPAGINTNFLAYIANVDGKDNADQPVGLSLVAPRGEQLREAFQTIAKAILARLTR